MSDMQADFNHRTIQEAASRLAISPATLRKWCAEFTDFLSPGTSNGNPSYTEQDIAYLGHIKTMMSNGLGYEEVREQLKSAPPPTQTASSPANDRSLAVNDENTTMLLQYFAENLSEMRQGQMSVLNSQAANRELMGVVIQDNFNLKEENARLRQRMLDLERQMGEIRRENQNSQSSLRQELESRIAELRQWGMRQTAAPALETQPGCLARLFGGGMQARPTPPHSQQQPPPPPGQQPGASRPFPRPSGPPE